MLLTVSNVATVPRGVPSEFHWPDEWRLPVAGDKVVFDWSDFTITRVILDPAKGTVHVRVEDV